MLPRGEEKQRRDTTHGQQSRAGPQPRKQRRLERVFCFAVFVSQVGVNKPVCSVLCFVMDALATFEKMMFVLS